MYKKYLFITAVFLGGYLTSSAVTLFSNTSLDHLVIDIDKEIESKEENNAVVTSEFFSFPFRFSYSASLRSVDKKDSGHIEKGYYSSSENHLKVGNISLFSTMTIERMPTIIICDDFGLFGPPQDE